MLGRKVIENISNFSPIAGFRRLTDQTPLREVNNSTANDSIRALEGEFSGYLQKM